MKHGGARPRSGVPKGYKQKKTLDREGQRELVRQLVFRQLEPLVRAQMANALGLRHTFMRDPKTKQFVRLTDPQQIADALNSGDEGKYYWTFTKDPSTAAFTDLLNRALDKPKEQEQDININVWKPLFALPAGSGVRVHRELPAVVGEVVDVESAG